jgi:hypothetical protein
VPALPGTHTKAVPPAGSSENSGGEHAEHHWRGQAGDGEADAREGALQQGRQARTQ